MSQQSSPHPSVGVSSIRVTVIGAGYVGLVSSACLAEVGHVVWCVDRDAERIAALTLGSIPIHEPGLGELVRRNSASGRLVFAVDPAMTVEQSEVVVLAVGTPPGEDGSADLSHVLAAAEQIAPHLQPDAVVVNKSTVPVGTASAVAERISARCSHPITVCSNPEFLKEGEAVRDFMVPDRIVVGVDDPKAEAVMRRLYAPLVAHGATFIVMGVRSAELTKYAANGMLATRIAYMNDLADLCEATGADIEAVRRGVGSDRRIGMVFLQPGPGFGGSCFPKDVRALSATARGHGVTLDVIDAVQRANDRHLRRSFEKAVHLLHGRVAGARIAIWGLAFKAGTDDVRESPAILLAQQLLEAGAELRVHDPEAMANARSIFGDRIEYAADPYAAAEGTDLLAIMTDWPVYRVVDLERLRRIVSTPRLVDARNLFPLQELSALGFTFATTGRDAMTSALEAVP